MTHLRPHLCRSLLVVCAFALAAPIPGRAAGKDASRPWPDISEEEKRLTTVPQDPGADAVILLNNRDGTVVQKGQGIVNLLEYHWRLKVLTERGKRYAQVEIPSLRKHSHVRDLEARTVRPDGSVVPVPPDQIFEKTVREVGSTKYTAFVFSFPAVETGAILEYRYRREDTSFIYIDPWLFAGPEVTLYSRMSQVVPEVAHYVMLCDKCPSPEPTRSEWKEGKLKGRRYTLEQRDLPGRRDEWLMPPTRDVNARAEMVLKGWQWTTWEALDRDDALFTDWDSVARYAGFYYARAYRLDEVAVRKLVKGWIEGIADPVDRVRAIYRHVQRDFRYLPYEDVIGSSRPIATLLKEGTADNEEKAVLLVAALRTQGLQPQIALVCGRNKGTLFTNFPSPSLFSHAVAGLPQPDGTTRWLDPTITYAPFGFIPWQDSEAGALLLSQGGGRLIVLPRQEETGGTRYRIVVKPRADGTAAMEVEAEFTGEDAIAMRDELVPAAETGQRSFLQRWVAERRPGAALASHAIENLGEVDAPLRLRMSIESPDLVTVADDVLFVRGCALSCVESNPLSRSRRAHPFYVDRGWNVEETVLIEPQEGAQVGAPPPPASLRSEFATLTLQCGVAGNQVRCDRRFKASRARYEADMQDTIRTFFDRVVLADRTTVPLQQAAAPPAAGR